MKLNYKSYGKGKPVIILHGLFGMLDNWKSFARELSADYRVYTPDLRDHGHSPKTDTFNYEILAEDLMEFIHEHSIETPKIIGHSMGGKAAIHLACLYPELVNQLVVVDIGIKQYERTHEQIFQAILKLDLDKFEQRSEFDKELEKDIPDFRIRQFLLKNLGRKSGKSFYWKANFPLLYNNYDHIIGSIQIPAPIGVKTLFVNGGQSDYLLPLDEKEIRKYFNKVHFHTIPDAGHWVHVDQPEELLEAVQEFFE